MNERNTIQKALVMQAVSELSSHPAAEDVYNLVAKKCPTISKGTVYRNLDYLSKTGLIKKIEIPDGADRYDHQTFKHYHVECVKCKKVFDVEMEFMENLEHNIKNKKGFEFLGHDIVFKGVCPDCK